MFFFVVAALAAPSVPTFELRAQSTTVQGRTLCFPAGLRVMVIPVAGSPVVGVTTIISGGNGGDPVGQEGRAHLLEHLWFRSRQGGEEVNARLGAWGVDHNAETGADSTRFYNEAAPGALDTLLDLEGGRLRDPLAGIDERTLAQERAIVISEFLRRRGPAAGPLYKALLNQLYPEGHPARSRPETAESLGAISLASLRELAQAAWRPENMTITLRGAVTKEGMDKRVLRALPEQANGHATTCSAHALTAAPPPGPPPSGEPVELEGPVAVRTAGLAWSLPVDIDRVEPRLTPGLLEWAVGVGMGWTSRQWIEHSPNCTLVREVWSSLVLCTFQAPRAMDARAIRARAVSRLREITQLDDDASTNYVGLAAQRAWGNLVAATEDVTGLYSDSAREFDLQVHWTGNTDWYERVQAGLLNVSLQSVSEYARVSLDPDLAVVAVMNPGAGFDDPEQSATSAAGSIAGSAVPPPPGASVIDGVAAWKLGNGLDVVVVPRPGVPMVHAALVFGVPSAARGIEESTWDFTWFDAGTLRTGYWSAIGAIGGTLSVDATADRVAIQSSGAAGNLADQLWVLATMPQTAHVDVSSGWRDYAREVGKDTVELRGRRPELWLAGNLYHRLFPGHPFGWTWSDAYTAGVIAFRTTAMQRWSADLWRPENATLYLVGQLDPAASRETIDAQFGEWKGSPVAPLPVDAPPPPPPSPSVLVGDQRNSFTARLTVACRVGQVEPAAADLAVALLNDRAWAALRTSEVASYDPSAGMVWRAGGPLLRLDARTPVGHVARGVTTALGLLEALGAEGPSPLELAAAKNADLWGWPARAGTSRALLQLLIDEAGPTGDLARVAERRAAVEAVTAEQVRQTFLTCSRGATTLVLGPQAQTLAQLSAAGVSASAWDWAEEAAEARRAWTR